MSRQVSLIVYNITAWVKVVCPEYTRILLVASKMGLWHFVKS